MIIKKTFSIFLFLIVCLVGLNSCSYFNNKLAKKPTSPTVRQEICGGLRRHITFDRSNLNVAADNPALPTDQARMMEEYKKYNCTDFEIQ